MGLLLAYLGVRGLVVLRPPNLPRAHDLSLDGWALTFTAFVCLLTGIAFGLAPAWHSLKRDLNEKLKESGRGSSEGREGHILRNTLVVSQVALALVLLVSAGLIIRSLYFLRRVDPGFDPKGVLAASVSVPSTKYTNLQMQVNFIEQLRKRLEVVPGIQSVATVFGVPLSGMDASIGLGVEGRPPAGPNDPREAGYRQVSPNYFRTLATPLLKGRDFTERDNTNAPAVMIVSEDFARKFFPGENPLGKRLTVGDGGPNPCEIVGIVKDVKRSGLDSTVLDWHPVSNLLNEKSRR